MRTIEQDVKELRREIKQLTETNQDIRSENNELAVRTEELEQYQRANNVEMEGVPANINPCEAVKKAWRYKRTSRVRC